MNRKRIWIGIGAVVLVIAGWLGYRQLNPSTPTVGSLIPSDALLILASTHLQDTVSERALRTQVSLRQIPIFDEASQRLERFLYAAGDTATVQQFVKGKNIRYSLHSLSKNTLDFIFYIATDTDDQPFINRLTNPNPRKYRILSHVFAGERVYDLQSLTNQSVGSFLLKDGYIVGSTSGVLVENTARYLHQPLRRSRSESAFQISNDHLGALSMRPNVFQTLFGNAGSLVRVFLPEELNLQFRPAASRSHLIGYASDEIGNRRDVANLFAGQAPLRIQSADVIPQTTATLYHIGVSDATRFGRNLSTLLNSASSSFIRERFKRISPVSNALYSTLGQDILLCRLESPTNAYRQVLILKARDVKQLSNAFQQAAYRAGAKAPATLKTFLGHKTLLLNIPELPASLFSSLFAGFRQSWITQHGSYLIVANSEDVMQDYLQQLLRGLVWSSDERQAELLNRTLRPANFTAFVRLNRAQTAVPASWPPAWQNLLDHSNPAMANLENMAYQASYGNEKILSTLILGRTTRRASQAVQNRVLLRKRVALEASLTSAPIVAGNLSDEAIQFYAPTNAGQFVLVTPDEDKLIQAGLDGPVRSNSLAVDFLDNGRLQYLFMTDRTLYVTDPGYVRPGRKPEKPLAIRLPDGLNPTYLVRPRGIQQRNFVALAAHQDGHIYALDRQSRTFVRLLTAPRKRPLLLPFQIITTPTGMEVLAMQSDGTLNWWQENGTQHPLYPARLDLTFKGPALLLPNRSEIQTITDEGELLRLNANGLIASRTQLYRPMRRDSFQLFPDETQTKWLLLRTTDTEVAILDQQGKERFQVRALQSGRNGVRYHRLGAGIEIISVKSGNFTTLYDLNGRIIGDRPIPSDYPVTLQFDERTNELYILSGVQKTVQLFSIRLR